MFIVTVNFTIKKGKAAEFTEVMKRQAQNSLNKERGCLQFDVCRAPDDEHRIFLYEVYKDAEAFELHLKSEHFLAFDRTVKDWTAAKSAEQWHRIDA
jgi:autoinducer 2-degrading protein